MHFTIKISQYCVISLTNTKRHLKTIMKWMITHSAGVFLIVSKPSPSNSSKTTMCFRVKLPDKLTHSVRVTFLILFLFTFSSSFCNTNNCVKCYLFWVPPNDKYQTLIKNEKTPNTSRANSICSDNWPSGEYIK